MKKLEKGLERPAPAVEVTHLRKVYRKPEVVAVDDVSFCVDVGSCFGLLGPNGAGKSTTLEIIQGLKRPTSGEVRIFGLEFAREGRHIRSRMGGVLQENQLYAKTKVREALELFASFYPAPRDIPSLLEELDLAPLAERFVKDLSGGQRQRVFLATALVGDPDLVFLDEPTTGLDPSTRQDFWRIVSNLKSRGKSIVLTTHYMEEAEALCDSLVIVDAGRVIEGGTPEAIIERVMKGRELPAAVRTATLNDVFLTLTGRGLEAFR
ncbi:MAG: ABC transporter ATP-binding protein [Silvanigrellales bacterium]|jgi:ABC-2 type transport system ATP-binding protein|nr:ABC transporter ATP-binding protein [Silvanigrellales bacterium]